MHQIETPQGRLFYLYWKLHRENRITIDAKNRLKDLTISNDSKISELLGLAKETQRETVVQDFILSFLDNSFTKSYYPRAESERSEESQSIKSARTMPRFNQLRPRIQIKASNWKLVNKDDKLSKTPKIESRNIMQKRLPASSQFKPPFDTKSLRIRSTTYNEHEETERSNP